MVSTIRLPPVPGSWKRDEYKSASKVSFSVIIASTLAILYMGTRSFTLKSLF